MKALVVGMVDSVNLGDRLIFESLRHMLARMDVETVPGPLAMAVGVMAGSAVGSGAVTRVRNAIRRSSTIGTAVNRVLWHMRSEAYEAAVREAVGATDCVIIGGGQLLTDVFFGLPPRFEVIGRVCVELGKPYAIVGCGASPVFSRQAARIYLGLMDNAAFVSVRGLRSAESLQRLRSRAHIYTHPDLAFGIRQVFPSGVIREEDIPVGICFQNVDALMMHRRDFRMLGRSGCYALLMRIIRDFERSGQNVELFTNGDPDDEAELDRFLAGSSFAAEPPSRAHRPTTARDLCVLIAGYRSVVAFRMHAAIAAASYEVPALNVAWDWKVPEVWSLVGASDVSVERQEFDSEGFSWAERIALTYTAGVAETAAGQAESMLAHCLERLSSEARHGRTTLDTTPSEGTGWRLEK